MFFAVSLPSARRFFVNLLPPNKFFKDYGKFVAFFPIALVIPVLLLWSQEPLIHSWQEKLSGFYLPIVFYVSRAENLGVKIRTKINLPENLSTDESDLALLISNLLENTINACSKQKFGDKIISVTIQSVERQCVLEIINSCAASVRFDENAF